MNKTEKEAAPYKKLVGYAIQHQNGKYYSAIHDSPVHLVNAEWWGKKSALQALKELQSDGKKYIGVSPVYLMAGEILLRANDKVEGGEA
jgi:hypothetical protein